MVGTLLVLIIIAGFALYQYIKGSLVSGFIFIVSAIIGIAAALGYYEAAADYIRGYGFIGAKAYALAFFLIFVIAFIIIREAANYVLKPDITFGEIVDRWCGLPLGIATGYIFAGVMMITIGLLPYRIDWLYGRFDDNVTNPPEAKPVLLSPDKFVSGLFGTLSNGSLKGTNSFAVVHADYVDQIFLNRHGAKEGVLPMAGDGAVSLVAPGIRPATENLMRAPKAKDQAPEPVEKQLTLVRLKVIAYELVPEGMEAQPKFMFSQLRLVLKDKAEAGDLSSGSAEVAYPEGYINDAGQLVAMPLSDSLDEKALKKGELDFAFNVPANMVPVLVEFRHNIVEKVRPMKAAEPAAAAPESSESNIIPGQEPNSEQPQ